MDKKYTVKFWADYSGDHRANPSRMEITDNKGFNELRDAIDFLNECTEPITTLQDLMPEAKCRVIIPCEEADL